MTRIEYLDRPPTGWFVLDVKKRDGTHKGDWVALMSDVDPDADEGRVAHAAWIRIPGKHRTKDMAWDALEDMIATRH